MKYRNLGKHGIKLPVVSLGTMYVGSHHSREQSHAVMKEAINQGINFIDTADRYGIFDSELPMDQRTRAEIIIGEFIKDYDRQDLVLSSKVFYKMREDQNSRGLSRKHIREGINESLNYLGTNYLDLYYCHRPDRAEDDNLQTPLEETIRTMSNLIDEGLVHYWGTSWWPPVLVERAIWIAKEIGGYAPSVEQPPYHVRARFIETDLFEIARTHGLGITSFEALGGGFYTGKYQGGIPEGSRGTKFNMIPEGLIERRAEMISKLTEIANELEVTLAQLMIGWSIRRPEISSSIMGASKPQQVIENAAAAEITLSQDIQNRIEEIVETKPTSDFR